MVRPADASMLVATLRYDVNHMRIVRLSRIRESVTEVLDALLEAASCNSETASAIRLVNVRVDELVHALKQWDLPGLGETAVVAIARRSVLEAIDELERSLAGGA